MAKVPLHRKHSVLVATVLAFIGLALPNGPSLAQQATSRWDASIETITVTTKAFQDLREVQRLLVYGNKYFVVAASMPVPYSDLDLAREADAVELDRRISLAARLVCRQIEMKYPSNIYPVMGSDDCAKKAADGGRAEATKVIAVANR